MSHFCSRYPKFHYSCCRRADVAIIRKVIILSAVMTSVIGLNVAVEIVLAPILQQKDKVKQEIFFKKFSNVLK